MNPQKTLKTLFRDDITIWYPVKSYDVMGKEYYESIPYSFIGILTSFSHPEDLIDFIKRCYIHEADCIAMCNELNGIIEFQGNG